MKKTNYMRTTEYAVARRLMTAKRVFFSHDTLLKLREDYPSLVVFPEELIDYKGRVFFFLHAYRMTEVTSKVMSKTSFVATRQTAHTPATLEDILNAEENNIDLMVSYHGFISNFSSCSAIIIDEKITEPRIFACFTQLDDADRFKENIQSISTNIKKDFDDVRG